LLDLFLTTSLTKLNIASFTRPSRPAFNTLPPTSLFRSSSNLNTNVCCVAFKSGDSLILYKIS